VIRAIDTALKSNIGEAFDARIQRLLEQIHEAHYRGRFRFTCQRSHSLEGIRFLSTRDAAVQPCRTREHGFREPASRKSGAAGVGRLGRPTFVATATHATGVSAAHGSLGTFTPCFSGRTSARVAASRIAAPQAESRTELDRSAAQSVPRAKVEARRDSLFSARTVGVVVAAVLVILAAVWIAADRPKPEPKLEQGSSNASSSGSQKTQPPKTPDSTNDTALRNLLLQESAQAALATGDFGAARQTA
jgi:hypothetical protein